MRQVYGDVWRWLDDAKVCVLKGQVVEAQFFHVHVDSVAKKATVVAQVMTRRSVGSRLMWVFGAEDGSGDFLNFFTRSFFFLFFFFFFFSSLLFFFCLTPTCQCERYPCSIEDGMRSWLGWSRQVYIRPTLPALQLPGVLEFSRSFFFQSSHRFRGLLGGIHPLLSCPERLSKDI